MSVCEFCHSLANVCSQQLVYIIIDDTHKMSGKSSKAQPSNKFTNSFQQYFKQTKKSIPCVYSVCKPGLHADSSEIPDHKSLKWLR
jgi:hypothetical protein